MLSILNTHNHLAGQQCKPFLSRRQFCVTRKTALRGKQCSRNCLVELLAHGEVEFRLYVLSGMENPGSLLAETCPEETLEYYSSSVCIKEALCDLASQGDERDLLNFLQNADRVCNHEKQRRGKGGRAGARARKGGREGVGFLRKNPAVLKLYVLGHMPTQRRRRRRHGGGAVPAAAVGAQFTRKKQLFRAASHSGSTFWAK